MSQAGQHIHECFPSDDLPRWGRDPPSAREALDLNELTTRFKPQISFQPLGPEIESRGSISLHGFNEIGQPTVVTP